MDGQWLEVTLAAPANQLEHICDVLTANGVAGLVVEEEGDFLRFLEQNRQFWDYVDEDLSRRMKGVSRVKFYVPDDKPGRASLHGFLRGLEEYEPQTVSLREEDWATSWQKYYQPFPVGRSLYIVPDWLRGRTELPEGRVPLYLDPGLTFGTGSHPTTQLCLELLEEVVQPGDRVLDLGCGSGILGIAALKLRANDVIGVDVDPKAVDAARENALLNADGLNPEDLTVLIGDVLNDRALFQRLRPGRNQIVLANIVADVIIPLSAVVGELLMPPEGWFVASGIIEERSGEVRAALKANGIVVEKELERSGWRAFLGRWSDCSLER